MTSVPSRRYQALTLTTIFVFVWILQWLIVSDLGGDDHLALGKATAFLKGDSWLDGFVDMGDPLFWFMSAMAQKIVGYRVIGEIVLAITLTTVALTLSYDMAWEASRSRFIAFVLLLVVVVLMMENKIYSYPKVFVYPLGGWLTWRYIEKQTFLRMFGLAVAVAVAFGFRHDHGLYVGLGASIAILIAHWHDGYRRMAYSVGRFVGVGIIVFLPFFVVVQINEGIVAYFTERIDFARQLDREGRQSVPLVIDETRPSFWVGIMPQPPARIAIEWTPEVSPRLRIQLETQYGLQGNTEPKGLNDRSLRNPGGWHSYQLLNPSDINLKALVADSKVNIVDGVYGSFRRAYKMEAGATGESLTVFWAEGVTDAERTRLEAQYQLVPISNESNVSAIALPGEPVQYEVQDRSKNNITALMTERAISQTQGTRPVVRPEVIGLIEPARVGPRIGLRWAEQVSAEASVAAEAQYQLVNKVPNGDDGRSFFYDLAEPSRANVAQLVEDTRVEDTGGIVLGSRIGIVWVKEISEESRFAAEAEYQLVNRRFNENEDDRLAFDYDITNVSVENVTRLVHDERVEDYSRIVPTEVEGSFQVVNEIEDSVWLEDQDVFIGARLNVQWAHDVLTIEERQPLEKKHGLIKIVTVPSGMYAYTMADASAARLKALISDRHVSASSGIESVWTTTPGGPLLEDVKLESDSWLMSWQRDFSILRLAVLPKIMHTQNAGAWLYYVTMLLPFLVIGLLIVKAVRAQQSVRMSYEDAKMLALGMMMIIVNYALMRKMGAFQDHVNMAMVFSAWCLPQVFQRWVSWRQVTQALQIRTVHTLRKTVLVAVVTVVVIISVGATIGYTGIFNSSFWNRSGFSGGVTRMWEVSAEKFNRWARSPPIDGYAPKESRGDRALLRYFYECTAPEDRIWAMTDMYTTPYYAERRIVRHMAWGNGFQHSAESQQRTIELVERSPVPILVGVGGSRPLQYLEAYEDVHTYAANRFVDSYPILQDRLHREGLIIWLSVDSRRTPTGTYEPLQLPCFR